MKEFTSDGLEQFTMAELLNELILREIITPKEAQLALMTKILPVSLDNEGEEWKKCLKK